MMSDFTHDDDDDDDENNHRNDNDDNDNETVAFKPGSIVRVELINFMTHRHAILHPKPRLNIVIGANGTGKSTVLNALCLGLGGDPKVLGRADQLASFVRHGATQATVLVTVANDDDDASTTTQTTTTFKRIIHADGTDKPHSKKGQCYINEQGVTLAQLNQHVRTHYRIALDNLCTFLPQDRVGDFSGLTDPERLMETEKTWVGQTVYQDHLDLIQAETTLRTGTGQVESVQASVNELERHMQPLQREKERMEQRGQAQDRALLYRQKMLWLDFEATRTECLNVKDEKSLVKQEWETAQQALAPLEAQVTAKESVVQQADASLVQFDATAQQHDKELRKQLEKCQKHDDEIENLIQEVSSLSHIRQRAVQEHQQCVEKVQQYQTLMKTHEPADQIKSQLEVTAKQAKTLRKAYDAARRETAQHSHELEQLQTEAQETQRKLVQARDSVSQRKKAVLRSDANVAKLAQYLEQHRNEFQRTVYGPIAAEVTMKNELAADYLEYHTPNNILKAFVVECREDSNRLYHIANQILKVPISVVTVNNGYLKPIERLFPQAKMEEWKHQHGIQGYLDDLFVAPDAVLQALRSYSNVDKAIVGNNATQKSIDHHKLLDTMRNVNHKPKNFALFSHASSDRSLRYTVKTSRGGFMNMRQDDITRKANLLAKGTNPRVEEELQEKLDQTHEQINQLRPSVEAAETAESKCKEASQEISLQLNITRQKHEACVQLKDKLRRAEQKEKDAAQNANKDDRPEKERLAKALMQRQSHSIAALEKHAEIRRQQQENTVAAAALRLDRQQANAALRIVEIELNEKKGELVGLQNKLTQVSQRFNTLKQQVRHKREIADKEAPLADANGEPLPLKDTLQALEVETVEQCQAALEEEEAVINSIRENNRIFAQLEDLEKKYQDEKEKLDELTSEKNRMLEVIKEKKNAWEQKVDQNVHDISNKFAQYMKEMGNVGQIRLKRATEGEFDNFADWGIEIMVAFREGTDAQVLSKQRHSGGERSVATILYLMALQELMTSPFRCVDEINQGLDERNERLVFKRIVANSTNYRNGDVNDHNGQYWLITPKLLHDLEGMEEKFIEVHCVFNGVHNFNHPLDGDLESFVEMAMKRSAEDAFDDVENDENMANGTRRKSRSRRLAA